VNFADDVKNPLMIVQGAQTHACPGRSGADGPGAAIARAILEYKVYPE
jgi:hypothetical protein